MTPEEMHKRVKVCPLGIAKLLARPRVPAGGIVGRHLIEGGHQCRALLLPFNRQWAIGKS